MTFMSTIYEKALEKHSEWQGKISTELKMPLETRDDLSVAYTPGVAEPCRQIHKNPDDVYKYTWKGNTIAVVSEAFVFAVKAGADPEKVYQAIRGGLAGSAVLDAKIPMIIERNFKPGGPIRINHKDIKNCVATAHAIDVPIPYTAQLYEILQTLKIHGHMNDDHGGIVQYFEGLADVEVKRK